MMKLLLPSVWPHRGLMAAMRQPSSRWLQPAASSPSAWFSTSHSSSPTQQPELHIGIVGLGAIGTIFFTKFAHLALQSQRNSQPSIGIDAPLALQVAALVRKSQLTRFRQHRDVALYTKAMKNRFGENQELLRISFPHQHNVKVDTQLHGELRHHNVVINTLDNMDAAQHRNPLDIVVVTVKTYDTNRVLEQLQSQSHLLKPNACVILLQNGLGEFPFERPAPTTTTSTTPEVCTRSWQLFTGVTHLGGKVMSLGHTLVSGLDAKTFFAPVCGPENTDTSAKMKRFGQVLSASGFNWQFVSPAQMQSIRWRKLIVNAAINPLTSIFDASNHTLAASPFARNCVQAIVSEAYDVAVQEGIDLDISKDELVDQTIQVADSTGPNTSSLLADLRVGYTQTEIDAINGQIVELGKKNGTPTPVNAFLLNIIKTMEEQKLRQI